MENNAKDNDDSGNGGDDDDDGLQKGTRAFIPFVVS